MIALAIAVLYLADPFWFGLSSYLKKRIALPESQVEP